MRFRGWPLLVAAAVGCETRGQHAQAILELDGDPVVGQQLFEEQCYTCHDHDDPTFDELDPEQMARQILQGDDRLYVLMPSFEDILSPQEIADVIAYLADRSL